LRVSVVCCYLFLGYVIFSPALRAQVKDFQTWNSIALEKKVTKKLDISISQELRLRDNSSELNSTFTDAGFTYEALKNFNIGLYYRLIIMSDGIAHRAYIDVSFKHQISKWTAQARIRLQHQEEKNELAENYIRPKVSLTYKINKKWQPYVSGELFYHARYFKSSLFDEYRLTAGCNYNFNKRNSIKFFYLFDQEFNVNAAEQSHVTGIAYQHNF
jgi:hypothetical protein